MSDFFSNWGRRLGRASAPALRKSKWLWQSMAGSQEEAIRAEYEFGRALAAELRAEWAGGGAEDARLLMEVASRLVSALPEEELRQFRVELARTGVAQAVALPGGFVFVDESLLEFCDRQPDELAFIVGHEMAHIVRRHTMERMLRRVGVEMIGTLLGRGMMGHWLRQTGVKLLQSAHDRETELEADVWAARLMIEAGFDPRGIARLLRRWRALREREVPENLGEYFASHPLENERLANLKSL